MVVHEVYAHVFEGEVKNIIVCDNYPTADYLAKAIYGQEAYAVYCVQYPCSIGDKHHDSKFWKIDPETGEEIEIYPKPTQEQEIAMLKADLDNNTVALAQVFGGE